MCWNNGLERKKFEKRQAILAEQYRAVGMTEDQIQMMYEFDLAAFRSERIYYTHTQSLEIGNDDDNEAACDISNFLLEYQQTEIFRDYSNRYWWIDELERFYYVAMSLSEKERELITMYVFEGHTQEEMAEILNCPQTTISYHLRKIKKRFLSAKGGQ